MIGLLTGSVYRTGVVNWIAIDMYWFSWFIFILILVCSVSLKAGGMNILWIDYVSFADAGAASSNRVQSSSRRRRADANTTPEQQRSENISQSTTSLVDASSYNMDVDESEEDNEYIDLETGRTISPAEALHDFGVTTSEETETLIQRNRDD